MSANYTNSFYRLFGDVNGNGVVVNSAFSKFEAAFGSTAGDANYVAEFDYSGYGIFNAAYIQFRDRYGSVWTSL